LGKKYALLLVKLGLQDFLDLLYILDEDFTKALQVNLNKAPKVFQSPGPPVRAKPPANW
jgi:hypothetical protein